jgi:hypothetical protein
MSASLITALDTRGIWSDAAQNVRLVKSRNALCREPSGAHRLRHPRAGSLQVLSHATVEVARHDLRVLPYNAEKSRSGLALGCYLSESNSVMMPVVGVQACQGSRCWHAAVVMS